MIPSVRTTAREKVQRDACVVADRARGLRWATIAKRNGLSETMCRKIWRERRSAEDFRSLRPAEVVDEAVAQLESVVEELAQLAASTRNDAVRLGAIKARAATLIQRLELLQALGRVPVAPRLRWEIGMEFTANAVLAIFDRYEVPHAATQELIDALRADAIALARFAIASDPHARGCLELSVLRSCQQARQQSVKMLVRQRCKLQQAGVQPLQLAFRHRVEVNSRVAATGCGRCNPRRRISAARGSETSRSRGPLSMSASEGGPSL
jgi:hypothetical protein